MALSNLTRITADQLRSANAASIAQLLDATHKINARNKYLGKLVRVTDNNKLASASGSAAGDAWNYYDGTVVS